jgi:hypothetical protein
MIMSLIIILPLISADTWFNKDPTIEQMMGDYVGLVQGIKGNSTAVREVLQSMVLTAQEGTYPLLKMHMETQFGSFDYPGSIMVDQNGFPPLEDFMRAELIEDSGTNYSFIFNGRGIS